MLLYTGNISIYKLYNKTIILAEIGQRQPKQDVLFVQTI